MRYIILCKIFVYPDITVRIRVLIWFKFSCKEFVLKILKISRHWNRFISNISRLVGNRIHLKTDLAETIIPQSADVTRYARYKASHPHTNIYVQNLLTLNSWFITPINYTIIFILTPSNRYIYTRTNDNHNSVNKIVSFQKSPKLVNITIILYLSLENIEKSFIFIEKFYILYLLDKEDLTKIYKIMNWSKN